MKPFLRSFLLPLVLTASVQAAPSIGLQMYSLRTQAKANVDEALATTASWGIKEVELASTYGLSAEEFAEKLKQHGLTAYSAHYGYDKLASDLDGVISEARVLGVKYVICPWLTPRPFNAKVAKDVADHFNLWGAKLRAAGLKLGYHVHGFEFTPTGGPNGETPLDLMIRETNPDTVTFEMDIFWVWSAGQDPKAWLERYPDRWRLAHLKDMRRDDPRQMHGSAKPEDNVAVGQGQIPWPELLPQFAQHHVDHFYIEDETSDPIRNVPASLQYLASLAAPAPSPAPASR